MALSPEVAERRRKGISATDAAPILGLSPWKSPADVWLDKRKPDLVVQKDSAYLYWGNRLEQTIAEEYGKVTCQDLEPSKLVVNPKVPWLMCSPDRLIKGKKKGVECKNASDRNAHQWGPTGTDRVPQHYLIQCFHSMMVTNINEWDLAVLIGGNDFRIYHLFADKELMKTIWQQEEEFYRRFIAGEETPKFDWGKSVAEFVRKKYPHHTEKAEFSVDDNGDEVVKQALLDLLSARTSKKTVLEIEATQKTLIEAYMRDAEVLNWKDKGVKITWRNVKDSVKVDWQKVFEEIFPLLNLPAEEKDKLLKRHTEYKTGVRRFMVYDGRGEEE